MSRPAGRRCLVTGATGFVGSYVVRALADDPEVEIAALLRPTSEVDRIAQVLARIRRIDGDLSAVDAAEAAIAAFAPDTLLHLAWTGVTNEHRNDAAQTENVAHTVRLVQLAQRVGVQHVVGLGSQAEYGPQHGALREDAPVRPTTLYGVSKLCAGLLTERLCAVGGMRFAWLRLFSCYGPHDHPSWMIPYLIERLLRGERPALTAGEQRWDYVYVADAADAIIRVARSPTAAGVFNLGSGRVESIRRVVERIRDLVKPGAPLGFGEVPYRPDQVMHLEADTTRLRAATGWTPQTRLEDGLRHTVEWHQARCSPSGSSAPTM